MVSAKKNDLRTLKVGAAHVRLENPILNGDSEPCPDFSKVLKRQLQLIFEASKSSIVFFGRKCTWFPNLWSRFSIQIIATRRGLQITTFPRILRRIFTLPQFMV